jgi:ABC-type transporter Mla subunit MlaD
VRLAHRQLALEQAQVTIAVYLIQVIAAGNKNARIFANKYQNSLNDMNNAAAEYVRGISAVFNQTIYSLRKFYRTLKAGGGSILRRAFGPRLPRLP